MKKIMQIIILIFLVSFMIGCTKTIETDTDTIPIVNPETPLTQPVIPEPIAPETQPVEEYVPVEEPVAEEETPKPVAEEKTAELAIAINEIVTPRSRNTATKRVDITIANNGEANLQGDLRIDVYTLKDDETDKENWYFDSNNIYNSTLSAGDSTIKTARLSSDTLFTKSITFYVTLTYGQKVIASQTKTVDATFI